LNTENLQIGRARCWQVRGPGAGLSSVTTAGKTRFGRMSCLQRILRERNWTAGNRPTPHFLGGSNRPVRRMPANRETT